MALKRECDRCRTQWDAEKDAEILGKIEIKAAGDPGMDYFEMCRDCTKEVLAFCKYAPGKVK